MDTQAVMSERIKLYRKQRMMTQEELAEEIGVTSSYIASIETGRRRLGLDALMRVCECLHVTMADILPVESREDAEQRAQWTEEILETLDLLDTTQLGMVRAMICALKP